MKQPGDALHSSEMDLRSGLTTTGRLVLSPTPCLSSPHPRTHPSCLLHAPQIPMLILDLFKWTDERHTAFSWTSLFLNPTSTLSICLQALAFKQVLVLMVFHTRAWSLYFHSSSMCSLTAQIPAGDTSFLGSFGSLSILLIYALMQPFLSHQYLRLCPCAGYQQSLSSSTPANLIFNDHSLVRFGHPATSHSIKWACLLLLLPQESSSMVGSSTCCCSLWVCAAFWLSVVQIKIPLHICLEKDTSKGTKRSTSQWFFSCGMRKKIYSITIQTERKYKEQ